MNSDTAFRIGKTHAVCQDYALGCGGEGATILIADGCSSSPDTDIGARLLTKAAESRLKLLESPEASEYSRRSLGRYYDAVISTARSYARRLGLDSRCLDATLMLARANDASWQVAVYGDGVIAARTRDGALHITSIAFSANYPDYLNYRGDAKRYAAFRACCDNSKQIRQYTVAPDGRTERGDIDAMQNPPPWFYQCGAIADLEWLAVMSDGVHSFFALGNGCASRAAVPIALPQLLPELLEFKNTAGQFVQRRLQRFALQCERRGWQHHDDVALGAIGFGGEVGGQE